MKKQKRDWCLFPFPIDQYLMIAHKRNHFHQNFLKAVEKPKSTYAHTCMHVSSSVEVNRAAA